MSYARWSDESSVYVFAHVNGSVQCYGCILDDVWDYHSAAEVVAHMRAHIEAGHKVPEYLFDESLYPPDDFIAMCTMFMCREQTGHEGDHTPVGNPRYEHIRAAISEETE